MAARVHVTGRDVFIVGAARTPIGRYGGTLKSMHPAELGAVAARAALERAALAPADVDEVFIGHGRQAGSGPNPGRQVASRAGVPVTAPAQTINQACASSLQAVALGSQAIELGQSDIVLSGGIESMSRMPYLVDSDDARWGHRMGDFTLVDAMYRDGFTCSISGLIMGQTAEILAREYGITREQSDEYALGSQQKAEAAIKAGRFADEIAPIAIEGRKGEKVFFAADEHPRAGSTLEGLSRLPLVFPEVEGQQGVITAGSSSGITDGGAAIVLAGGGAVAARGLAPMARVIGWATAGVDPRMMGIGPVPAVRALLEKTGLTIDDFDLVELNEAFAPQVLAVLRDLPIEPARLNVNGGAIALGHPIGATGARILVTLVHEMKRRGAKRGLATLCVSGGLGMALAVENV
ncbi:MAG TPA: acetyl-CoA C-acyltransferase [Vicinamibacterales bacterium]